MHQNQMQRDIYNHCMNKLRLWARDSQQLHEMGDVPVNEATRNIMWLLMSLAAWVAVNAKVSEDVMIDVLVRLMRDHMENSDVNGTHEESDWDQP